MSHPVERCHEPFTHANGRVLGLLHFARALPERSLIRETPTWMRYTDRLQCSGEMTSSAIAKNWWYAPSVYNSRVSSVGPTPHDIPRPKNVYFSAGVDSQPAYGPTRKLDFELEMGFYVSTPVAYGEGMPIGNARDHIFGFVMLNDWSARDHQLFEMRPLGPFHSKVSLSEPSIPA